MNVRFFDPGKWYLQHKEEVDSTMQRVLADGDLILRGDVDKFEQNLAKFVGKKYAVGLNSGTDALYLSLWALGIGPGDEVILPSHTFVATAQVVHQLGATPVLVDMGEGWEKYKTDKTKVIIPAHIAGDTLNWLPTEDVVMIEDACQAIGAKGVGNGLAQCWSFYPAKILGCFGDAGAITTDDEGLYNEIMELRNHYKKDYSKWGINSRLDNLQAAVLNIKMKYLPDAIARREQIAKKYLKELDGVISLPHSIYDRVWQDFIVYTSKRDDLYNFLKEEGVETMKNEYPFPIQKGPESLDYESCTLRLPINEVLEDDEVQYVIDSIKSFYAAMR